MSIQRVPNNDEPITVVKVGGQLLDDAASLNAIVAAITQASIRTKLVVVHGGGTAVTELLTKLGIEAPKINGLRATNAAAIGPVVGALAGTANKSFTAALRSEGCNAVGLCLGDGGAAIVERHPDAALGCVGLVTGGTGDLWRELLAAGRTPVVSSIGFSAAGELLNVNADDAALGAALAVGASALVLVTDTPGVLDADGAAIPFLDEPLAQSAIESGIIHSGMVPKVNAALQAAGQLSAPVRIVHFSQISEALASSAGHVGTTVSSKRLRPMGSPEPTQPMPV